MKKLLKISLFLASYFPLYLFMEVKLYNIERTPQENFCDNMILNIVIVLFFIVGLIGIFIIEYNDNYIAIGDNLSKITPVENISVENLSYIMSYIIPLISNLESKRILIINLLLFIIIAIIYIKNNLVYLNISLMVLGYSIYRNNSNEILISKNTIEDILNNLANIEYNTISPKVHLIRIKKINENKNNQEPNENMSK